jgi:hypothetical protein
MDWLADSRKSAKPKTSNNNLTKQNFRASFAIDRNFNI